jgi:hypothetical protein
MNTDEQWGNERKRNWSTLYTVLIRVPHRGRKVTAEGQQIQLMGNFESHEPEWLEVSGRTRPSYAWLQASVAIMWTALFWDCLERGMVIPYRRFGTTYRSHLQGSSSPRRPQCVHRHVLIWSHPVTRIKYPQRNIYDNLRSQHLPN